VAQIVQLRMESAYLNTTANPRRKNQGYIELYWDEVVELFDIDDYQAPDFDESKF